MKFLSPKSNTCAYSIFINCFVSSQYRSLFFCLFTCLIVFHSKPVILGNILEQLWNLIYFSEICFNFNLPGLKWSSFNSYSYFFSVASLSKFGQKNPQIPQACPSICAWVGKSIFKAYSQGCFDPCFLLDTLKSPQDMCIV